MLTILLQVIQTVIETIEKKYRKMMQYVSYSVLKDHQLAEDAVQESLLIIDKNQHKLEDLDSARAKNYIYTVTKNEALHMAEKNFKNNVTFSDPETFNNIEGDVDVNSFCDEYGFSAGVSIALNQLSEADKDMICYRYGGGYSFREIAGMMDTDEAILRKRMERARKKLRKIIKEDNERV